MSQDDETLILGPHVKLSLRSKTNLIKHIPLDPADKKKYITFLKSVQNQLYLALVTLTWPSVHSVKFSVSFMKNSVERVLFYYCYKLLNWSLCSLLISSAVLPDSNFLDFIMFKMHQISQSRILQNTSLLCERGISHNEFYAFLNKHQNFVTSDIISLNVL